MKKIVVGLISAALLGIAYGASRSASAAQGADDLCGGCPKDFKCAVVGGVPQCVPEDGALR